MNLEYHNNEHYLIIKFVLLFCTGFSVVNTMTELHSQ